ncbi:MAG: hypothetical protein QFB86_03420 [Patescibacteria group bacterium]|nr:hypothetical protein [Patescibacteria group bacterium]
MLIVRRILFTILIVGCLNGLQILIRHFKEIVTAIVPHLSARTGCDTKKIDAVYGSAVNCQGLTQAVQIGLLIAIFALIVLTIILIDEAIQAWKKKRN